ncbi:MAG: hypothetical protein ABL971_16995 [Vicinamibacterales bacterium]
MNRRLLLAMFAGLLTAGLVPMRAHDDYRIIGTIGNVTLTGLDVKEPGGRTVPITLDAATRVTRDGKKASVLDLKTGLYVVVDASGDSLDDLLAIDVRIVPPPPMK